MTLCDFISNLPPESSPPSPPASPPASPCDPGDSHQAALISADVNTGLFGLSADAGVGSAITADIFADLNPGDIGGVPDVGDVGSVCGLLGDLFCLDNVLG